MNKKFIKIGLLISVVFVFLVILATRFWASMLESQNAYELADSSQSVFPKEHQDANHKALAHRQNDDFKVNRENEIKIGDISIPVNLKSFDHKSFEFDPSVSASEIYNILSTKALEGDFAAARALAIEIDRCVNTFTSKESLDTQIETLESTGKYTSPSGDFDNYKIRPEDVEYIVQDIKSEFEHCAGMTSDQKLEYKDWLKLASDNGDFIALDLISADLSNPAEERRIALETTWNLYGSRSAAIGLGMFYRNQQELANGEILESAPIKSAAYFMVGAKLEQLTFGAEDSFNAPNMTALFDQAFASITAGLSISEYDEAEKLAISLLSENDNCCYTATPIE